MRYHVEIVEQKAVLRQLVESGTAIAAMGYEGGSAKAVPWSRTRTS